MMKNLALIVVANMAVLTLVACETSPVATTTVDRVLMSPDIENAPYSNILIVGAMPTRDNDRLVEEGLTQELRARKIEAHSFVKESAAKRPSEDDVYALVIQEEVDAVIVVTARFAGAELRKRDEQVDVQAQARRGGLLDFFRYDYKEVTQRGYEDVSLSVRLVSDFYDARTRKRIYSLESSTAHGQTSYEIVKAESKAIVTRLRKDGLIK